MICLEEKPASGSQASLSPLCGGRPQDRTFQIEAPWVISDQDRTAVVGATADISTVERVPQIGPARVIGDFVHARKGDLVAEVVDQFLLVRRESPHHAGCR